MGLFKLLGDVDEFLNDKFNSTGVLKKKKKCEREYDKLNERFSKLKLPQKKIQASALKREILKECKELDRLLKKRDYDSCLGKVGTFSSLIDEVENKIRENTNNRSLPDINVGPIISKDHNIGGSYPINNLIKIEPEIKVPFEPFFNSNDNKPPYINSLNEDKKIGIPILENSSANPYKGIPKSVLKHEGEFLKNQIKKLTGPTICKEYVQKTAELNRRVMCGTEGGIPPFKDPGKVKYTAPISNNFGSSIKNNFGTEGWTLPMPKDKTCG